MAVSAVERLGEPAFEAVLYAAQAGAAWALRSLYEQLASQVGGYLRGQGAADPDSSTNEVFLRAFRKIGDFNGDAVKFRSWVFTIAHNVLIDERRRRSRRITEIFSGSHVEPAIASASAEDVALSGMASDDVTTLLRQLPEDQREVLLLRLVADLTVAEVARSIGRTEAAVKGLQRRAVRNLQRLSSEKGGPS